MAATLRLLAALLALTLAVPALANTLATVKERGHLRCGVSQGLAGFSSPAAGGWSGIDVDFCRAVAAAVLGDAKRVRFTPLSAKERFTALQSGEIDLLSRNTTWTATRDTQLGFHFAGVIYYDGQGFMVRRDLGVSSVKELDGAAVCANAGTTTELNAADYFRTHGMQYTPIVFEKSDEVVAAYEAGRCDVYTTDVSGLYAQRLKLKDADQHIILPEVISKEPLGPLVRQGDDGWFNIVKWTLFALIEAEELGVSSENVQKQKKSANPAIRRLLNVDGNIGANIGLPAGWVAEVIGQLGNYGEIYQRNLGEPPLSIPRGQNALWTEGGLMYAPPFR
jgi:general L-amino acid transport system substrate-binding protein